MTKANGDYGKEGKDARKLLERRGLTKDVVNAARALLDKVSTIEKRPPPLDLEEERRKLKTAEDAMWGGCGHHRERTPYARGRSPDHA